MAYDVERINGELIKEQSECKELIGKVRSCVTEMTSEKAISHGFVPGARLVENKVLDKVDKIIVPEDVKDDVKDMDGFKLVESTFNLAKDIREVVGDIYYQYFCDAEAKSVRRYALDNIEKNVNVLNKEKDGEKDISGLFDAFITSIKDFKEKISVECDDINRSFKGICEKNEGFRSRIKKLYREFVTISNELGKKPELAAEDIYKDTLRLGDGFSIENGINNLNEYCKKLTNNSDGTVVWMFKSVWNAFFPNSDVKKYKTMDIDKLTETREGALANFEISASKSMTEKFSGVVEQLKMVNAPGEMMRFIENKLEKVGGFGFLKQNRKKFEDKCKKLLDLKSIAKENFKYAIDASDSIIKIFKEKRKELYSQDIEGYFENIKNKCSEYNEIVENGNLKGFFESYKKEGALWHDSSVNIETALEKVKKEIAERVREEKKQKKNAESDPDYKLGELFREESAEKEKPVEEKEEPKKEEKAEAKPAAMVKEIDWLDWKKFKKVLDNDKVKVNDVGTLIKRYKSLESRFKNLDVVMPKLKDDDIVALEVSINSIVWDLVQKVKGDEKVGKYKVKSLNDSVAIDKAMKEFFNAQDEADKNEHWNSIKKIINDQLDALERLLVVRTQEIATKEERGFLGKAVDFMKDGWDAMTGAPVKLTLDSTMAEKFKTMSLGVNDLCTIQFIAKDLRSLFKNVFQDRKSTYKSWYNYVDKIVYDVDKCIKKYSNKGKEKDQKKDQKYEIKDVKSAVQISLMYVFLRSMVHCDLKDVNTIREGIKRFVSAIDENISSKKDVNKVEGTDKTPVEVMKAGAKTRQICKDVKSSMNEVLNRKKSLRDDVLNKDQCKMILEFIPDNYKSKLRTRIVK